MMDTRRRRKEVYLQNSVQNVPIPPKRTARVHAQRKFAYSNASIAPLKELKELKEKVSTNNECENKDSSSLLPSHPKNNAIVRPKTEDFLTFLCFRGTTVLPPHLECFESPQFTERWSEPTTLTPPQDDKPYKLPVKRGREEVAEKSDSSPKDCAKRNLEPIHVDVSPITPARVTRSSASLTPTPSFLSSPRSSECSPNHVQRKLTRNQLLLKKAMLIKSRKSLAQKRNARILLKKKTAARTDNARITRSGTQQSQVVQSAPKSPIMACRKTVKASHISKRKKSLCRMLKRIGIMGNAADSSVCRKTRSQSDVSSLLLVPKKLHSCSTSDSNNVKRRPENLLKEKASRRKRRQLTPTCSLSPSNSGFMDKVELRQSLDRRLIQKQKKCLPVLAERSTPAELKAVDCEDGPKSRKRKCLGNKEVISAGAIKQEHEPLKPHMKGRPARKTKQVAEVYLELFSQKLAKEAEVGLEVSDEEDTISISSIKELKAVAKAKHKLDMKKCVKEFTEKHDAHKGSPVKTPSPLRPRCSSESSTVKKQLVKRNLFHSDTEDSEAAKDRVSKCETLTVSKLTKGRNKTKPIEKLELDSETSNTHLKTTTDDDITVRATVRLSRLKSPQRNLTSPRLPKHSHSEDKLREGPSNAESKSASPQSGAKIKGKGVGPSLTPSPGKLSKCKTAGSPSKRVTSGQNSNIAKDSLRKIRSDKELRRMATQFLESRCDLPLPKIKKKKVKHTTDHNIAVLKGKPKPEKSLKLSSSVCQLRLRRAVSVDEANSTYKLGIKEPLQGGLIHNEKHLGTSSSAFSKSLLKIDDAKGTLKQSSPKPRKKPLRRKSLHDNTQLSAVLEKIAQDFEKQIDISACTKIESDFNSGNKSPEKNIKSEQKLLINNLDGLNSHSDPGVSLKIPKVTGTKCPSDEVKKGKGVVIADDLSSVNIKVADEIAKVSETKHDSQCSDNSPALSAKSCESTNQHCTAINSPLKTDDPLVSEPTLPVVEPQKIEESVAPRDSSQSLPYIPEVPKPKFTSSLTLESNVKHPTNINLTATQSLPIPFNAHGIMLGGATTLSMPICQLQPAVIPPTIGHIAPGIAISQPLISSINDVKPSKIENNPTKGNSKQILIAPKPSKNIAGLNSLSSLKLYQKPIAPKVVANNGPQPASVSPFAASTPILTAPAVGPLVQTLQHPIQTVQTLPQALHTMQAIPHGVQSIQTLHQNYQTLGAVAPTVQGVIPHTIPLNTAHLGTPSSPAKLIAPPVFVSSSVPNVVAAPFDFTVGQLPGRGITSVAQVMAQNVVGKVVPKSQVSMATPAPHPLVTLGSAADGSIISSFVPLNRPGQPQFLTVSMMPIVTNTLSASNSGFVSTTATIPHVACSQSIAPIAPCLPTLNGPLATNLNSAVSMNSNFSYSSVNVVSSASAIPSSYAPLVTPDHIINDSIPKDLVIAKIPSDSTVSSHNDMISNVNGLETKAIPLDRDNTKDIERSTKESKPDSVTKKKVDTSPKTSPANKLGVTSENVSVPLVVTEASTSRYSPMEPSSALSQALSKLYPLSEAYPVTCSSTTSYHSLQINTHIYTSASLISPQAIECGFSRQKAVTQVSQSSPPYVLSTSASDLHKSIKVPVYKSSHVNIQKDATPTESGQSFVEDTISKGSLPGVKDINKEPSLKEPILPLLSKKLFYSSKNKSQFNKCKKNPALKPNEVKNNSIEKNSVLSMENNKGVSVKHSACNSEPSCYTKSTLSHSKPASAPCSKPISSSKPSTTLCNKIISHNELTTTKCGNTLSHSSTIISNKSIKKEPLLKKTLFKHKSLSEHRSADAFSALNESSVYAFEPDVDSIDVSTPFVKRLKKINSNEEVSQDKLDKELKPCDISSLRANSSCNFQSLTKSHTVLEKVDVPKKGPAPKRFTKLDLSEIEASVKLDFSYSSSIDETEDEDEAPVELVSITPVYSNSSADEEHICNLPRAPKKEPAPLPKTSKIKEKTNSSLRSVRMNQPVSERPSTSLLSARTNIQNLSHFKINPNLKRRSVARIPMNRTLGSIMDTFPPNSIQSVSSANSILASRASVGIDVVKFPSSVEPVSSSTKASLANCVIKHLPNANMKRKCLEKCGREQTNDSLGKLSKKDAKKIVSCSTDDKKNKVTKQPVQSTSIAIQCDLDDSSNLDDNKPNESGTQTEVPPKLPLPPSASPFYYLPLAMATLGEELPAQLVQQMLAKTQGLVGETEAKMILRQAAQLAQQYHKNIDVEGVPSLPAASSAKPISPKSGNLALQKVLKATFSRAGLAGLEKSATTDAKKKATLKEQTTDAGDELKSTTTKDPEISNSSIEKKKTCNRSAAKSRTKEACVNDVTVDNEALKVDESSRSSIETDIRDKKPESISNSKLEMVAKRRSGRSSTSASTKATEFDINEAEEIRRNRRAKRAAASLAREEGWSSSSEAPLSPTMSPDSLRGWPSARLTSPTPSVSSEGTTSSTPSHRSRISMPRSRRPSPIVPRPPKSNAPQFATDPVIDPGPLLLSESSSLLRAPSFFPTEDEFDEPLDYIEKIRPEAEHFGLCRIVPPSSFRPECRVSDDMRFTPCKQYIQRVMKRWGHNTKVMNAIRKCLANQKIELISNPMIGTLELDLVRLYEVVEEMGGLMRVIESELWGKVADTLRISKSTQDRLTKLDSIYCKYLLPYAMLSEDERKKLLSEVEDDHKKDSSRKENHSDDEDEDINEFGEFVVNGKSTALSSFYRVSKNVASQWQPDPDGLRIDERYWNIVKERTRHVCVHTASIDTAEHGYGFPSQKNSPSAKHPWNLKNICQNPSSILRSMADVIGVSAPTLHVGMMFSTVCWYRDPHNLPWIEYLHTGSRKIWYGMPASQEKSMKEALTEIVPEFVKDSPLWLPSDATIIPPDLLVGKGLKVSRIAQEPGQFVVVFPGAFTSSVCSGYVISESAFYARPQYFSRAVDSFKTLRDCCEPAMFSLDRLALSVASDTKASFESLQKARCLVEEVVQREKQQRKKLIELGLTNSDRMPQAGSYKKKKSRYFEDEEENVCEICKQHLYVSVVFHKDEETGYCLQHAIRHLECHPEQLKQFKLIYSYTLPELTSTLKQMDERISLKGSKKPTGCAKRSNLTDNMDSFSSNSSSNF